MNKNVKKKIAEKKSVNLRTDRKLALTVSTLFLDYGQ